MKSMYESMIHHIIIIYLTVAYVSDVTIHDCECALTT